MKQVILKKGIVFSEEVAKPVVSEGSVLIRTVVSYISAGTELASIQTSDKPLIKRDLEQPEEVSMIHYNYELYQAGDEFAYKCEQLLP